MNKTDQQNKKSMALVACAGVALCALFVMLPDLSHASAGYGGPLDSVYDTLREWTTGSIGKVITLAMILVGIVAGIARQSLLAFAIGIGGGLGLYNTPSVVEAVFTAVLK